MRRGWIILLAGLSLVGCATRVTYDNTTSSVELVERAVSSLGQAEDYLPADEDHFDFYFGTEDAMDEVEDFSVVYHRETTNVNEIGIFRVDDEEDVPAVRAMVQNYLDGQVENLRAFAANYSPRDMKKIEGASVRVLGTYVIYYILDEEDAGRAMRVLEEALTRRS